MPRVPLVPPERCLRCCSCSTSFAAAARYPIAAPDARDAPGPPAAPHPRNAQTMNELSIQVQQVPLGPQVPPVRCLMCCSCSTCVPCAPHDDRTGHLSDPGASGGPIAPHPRNDQKPVLISQVQQVQQVSPKRLNAATEERFKSGHPVGPYHLTPLPRVSASSCSVPFGVRRQVPQRPLGPQVPPVRCLTCCSILHVLRVPHDDRLGHP